MADTSHTGTLNLCLLLGKGQRKRFESRHFAILYLPLTPSPSPLSIGARGARIRKSVISIGVSGARRSARRGAQLRVESQSLDLAAQVLAGGAHIGFGQVLAARDVRLQFAALGLPERQSGLAESQFFLAHFESLLGQTQTFLLFGAGTLFVRAYVRFAA